jgi:hypothetical protein
MATVLLNINDKKPVVNYKGRYGPKTLFVVADQNWPQAAGEPCVPLDIRITIRTSYDNVYVEDYFPLPNLGWSGTLLADNIDVFAHYIPDQGLITPYTTYQISASIIPGDVTRIPSSYIHLFRKERYLFPVTYPTAGMLSIPNFSTEFRVEPKCYGRVMFRSHPNSYNYLGQTYNFEEAFNWYPLSPFDWQWNAYIDALEYTAGRQSFAIWFR